MRYLLILLSLAIAVPTVGQTAQARLWDGAISGDTVAIAQALREGAVIDSLDLRTSQNGRRALNWTAINNHVDAVRFLLAHGAAIEATNLTGYTALHHAAEHGSMEVARVLLAAGANPKHTNLEGVTPAARARQEGFIELAELLEAAERGAKPKGP